MFPCSVSFALCVYVCNMSAKKLMKTLSLDLAEIAYHIVLSSKESIFSLFILCSIHKSYFKNV